MEITFEIKPKIKDPRRVEAGKRLAAISKQAKEKKARERLLAEQEQEQVETKDSPKFLIAGLILAGAVAYYAYNKIPRNKQPERRSEQSKQSEQSGRGDKLVNLFD